MGAKGGRMKVWEAAQEARRAEANAGTSSAFAALSVANLMLAVAWSAAGGMGWGQTATVILFSAVLLAGRYATLRGRRR